MICMLTMRVRFAAFAPLSLRLSASAGCGGLRNDGGGGAHADLSRGTSSRPHKFFVVTDGMQFCKTAKLQNCKTETGKSSLYCSIA